MSFQFTNTRERCVGVGQALTAIEQAREILARLEWYAERTADKKPVDFLKVLEETGELRECVNDILVGLTLARSIAPVPDRKSKE